MPLSEKLRTQGWAAFFGILTGAVGLIQFGEAIYKFVDIETYVKDAALKNRMQQTALLQVILTAIAIFIGTVTLICWKMESVPRTFIRVLGILTILTAGYGMYMVYRVIDIGKEPAQSVQEQLMLDRFQLLEYVNIGMVALLLITGFMMVWVTYFVKE